MNEIIKYQKHKTFGEILFEIQNAEVFLRFRKQEKRINMSWKVFVVVYYVLLIPQTFNMINCDLESCKYKLLIDVWIVSGWIGAGLLISVLILYLASLLVLLNQLRKYHRMEYELKVRGMVTFFVFIGAYGFL